MSNLEKYERSKLMQGANAFHHRVSRKGKEMLEMANEVGERLNTLKADTAHGQWLRYLDREFDGSRQNAWRYMRINENWSEIEAKCNTMLHLGIAEAIKILQPSTDNEPPPQEPLQVITAIQPESPSVPPVGVEAEPVEQGEHSTGGSPADRQEKQEDSKQNSAGHAKPPFQDTNEEESRSMVSGTSIRAGHAQNSTTVGGKAKKKPSRPRETSAPRIKSNPDAELIRHVAHLKKTLLLLLSYLPNKEYYLNKEAVFVSSVADDVERTLNQYLRALRTRSDVRANPPTLEEIKTLAAELDYSDEDALDYFEARDRSGWHYGTPAVNPVRDVRRDMPAYLRLRRRGEAQQEQRYQKTKAESQARARDTDLMTATAEYLTEEEYNARQNGKTP